MSHFWQTLEALFRDMYDILATLGALTLLAAGNFFLWRKYGFWVPRYVHYLAAAALALVVFIDILWVRTGEPMALRRWLAIPFFPGLVYFLFVGYGGVKVASDAHKQRNVEKR